MTEHKRNMGIMMLALLSPALYVVMLSLAQQNGSLFLTPLVLLFTAIPALLACRIGGPKLCLPLLLGALFLIGGIWGFHSALDYGTTALLGVAIGSFARYYTKAGEVFLPSLTLWIAGFLLRMVLEYRRWGINILAPSPETISLVAKELEQLVGPQSTDTIQLVSAQLPMLMPFALVCTGVLVTALVYILSSLILKRFGMALPAWPPLISWRVPRSLLWAYFFCLFVLLIPSMSGKLGQAMSSASVSIELLLRVLFMIQGVAVAAWWLLKKGMNSLLQYLLFPLVLVFPLVGQIATMAGIIDLWIDFRTRYGGESS